MFYKVKIRRELGAKVRLGAEQLDGRIYEFSEGWEITDEDPSMYIGETAMVPYFKDKPYPENYPLGAPTWIASGDLEKVDIVVTSVKEQETTRKLLKEVRQYVQDAYHNASCEHDNMEGELYMDYSMWETMEKTEKLLQQIDEIVEKPI
jgi:hypothetical protein